MTNYHGHTRQTVDFWLLSRSRLLSVTVRKSVLALKPDTALETDSEDWRILELD